MVLNKKILIGLLAICFLWPLQSFASCSGINRSQLNVEAYEANAMMTYLSFTPQVSGQKLTISGTSSSLTVSYNNSCEVFSAASYNGIMVSLLDGGEEYDGSALNAHQLVYGGAGSDIIQTGNAVDYIYAGAGNDVIYTYDDFEKVDGGDGTDCIEEGGASSVPSTISNVEVDSCDSIESYQVNIGALTALCIGQNGDFSATLYNDTTWLVEAVSSDINLTIEKHGFYLLAYTENYRHCEYTNAAESINVKLSDGNDTFNSESVYYSTIVRGMAGKDNITTGAGGDLIWGGEGDDYINAGAGNDWVAGDSCLETDHDGTIACVSGSTSGDGEDRILGGDGDDVLFGNSKADRLEGGNGNDLLFGNDGNEDRLYGNSGEDLLVDSGGNSWGNRAKAWGGSGQDIIVCESGHCELSGGGSKDFLVAIATYSDIGLYGGDGGDILFVRGDEIPSGTGGSGTDYCYTEWYEDDDVCDYMSSVNAKSGDFDDAVRKAASGMSAVHEVKMKLSNFDEKTGYSTFKQRIADLVASDVFNAWLADRSLSVFD